MEELVVKLDTIILAAFTVGAAILKIADNVKRSARIKKVDAKDREQLNQLMKNRLNSLQALIYSSAPLLMRLEAFLEYLKLGGNHSTVEWALTYMISPNKDLWWSVVNEYRSEPPVDAEFFKENMARISGRLEEKEGA